VHVEHEDHRRRRHAIVDEVVTDMNFHVSS
jgi:hypothetical protein